MTTIRQHRTRKGEWVTCHATVRPCPLEQRDVPAPAAGADQFAAEYTAAKKNPEVTIVNIPKVNWSNRTEVLFKTPHGSRLYGLAHANSDEDYFIVYPISSFTAKQSIADNIDATRMSFNYFVEKASKGSHQALEAMFSRQATVDQFAAFRAGFHASGSEVIDAYYRTIRSFSMGETYKKRRHALRLALNLTDIVRYGRFDPTLSEAQARRISEATNEGVVPSEAYLDVVRSITPYEFQYAFEEDGEDITEHLRALEEKRQK